MMTPKTNNFYTKYLVMHANALLRKLFLNYRYRELKFLGYLNCYYFNNLKVGNFFIHRNQTPLNLGPQILSEQGHKVIQKV